MKTLYIMCGVGFSGKSTLSKKIAEYLGAVLVSWDAVYFEMKKERGTDPVRGLAKEFGAETKVVFLDTPIDIQKLRQESNKTIKERHDVKQEYLDKAIAELETPTEDENVIVVKPDYDFNELTGKL